MLFSNIFLFLPVVAAAWIHEWLYFAFALGLSIFSPLYHYLKIYKPNSKYLPGVKAADWLIAVGAYLYMFYFIFTKDAPGLRLFLFSALTFTVLFFWYGFRFRKYKNLHPWFHVMAPIVSSIIVISKL